MMTPRAFYHMMGKRNFLQYIFFAAFLFFFYVPLMNLCMLAFADKYEVPAIIPQKFGFKWWEFVLDQNSLMGSITTSFALAIESSSCPFCSATHIREWDSTFRSESCFIN